MNRIRKNANSTPYSCDGKACHAILGVDITKEILKGETHISA